MTSSPTNPQVFPILGSAAQILASIDLPKDPLRARKALEGRVTAEVALAAVELADLRRRAAPKFRDPDRMLLTRKGLEQATHLLVASWRAAEVLRLAPGCTIWDQTAGLGADALALALAGLTLEVSEQDPLHAACCEANLAALGFEVRVRVGDSRQQDVVADLILLDPDRRADSGTGTRGGQGGGRRRLDPSSFSPPVEDWRAALEAHAGGVVKLPPGLDPAELVGPLGLADLPHRWTWTEAGGALRELTLWTGCLAPAGEPGRAAVRLFDRPAGHVGAAVLSAGTSAPPRPFVELDPDALTLLAEPRPSVLVAGLAERAGEELALEALDPASAYLASDRPDLPEESGPFLDLFRVVGSSPLDRKRVRKLLGQHGIGPLTVKKRGVDETSDQLAAKFGQKRGQLGLAIVSPTPAGRRLYLVERLPRGAG
ncbi:MAG: hypothetical protein P1V81_03305 [Planctomycetota bacterium]|nr:hypothetical protein [Planctomycetota bacterium]